MQAKIEKRQAEINAKKAAKQQKILDDAAKKMSEMTNTFLEN